MTRIPLGSIISGQIDDLGNWQAASPPEDVSWIMKEYVPGFRSDCFLHVCMHTHACVCVCEMLRVLVCCCVCYCVLVYLCIHVYWCISMCSSVYVGVLVCVY